ncbi:YCF36, putative (DUF1230) isoform X2 [Tasmannia lanceolata]|uniref:YCF36, putative (DUF1230) isoform X2 n=1 Tax=Tasmannia lanceolata TaxID=3420 RepID=UPI0040627EBC
MATTTAITPHPFSFKPPLSPSLPPIFPTSKFSNPNPRKTYHLFTARFSSSSPFRKGTPPETDCPVPSDQLPVNEYQNLAGSFPFSWAAADLRLYSSRLLLTGASFALFVGLPVAGFGVVDPEKEALKCIVGALAAGLFAVTFAVLRIYLGWAYVGNRLLSATVEYEETGWYDGQVKPVLNRVKLTLVGLAISLVMCVMLFINIENANDSYKSQDAGERIVAGVYNDTSARSFEPDAFCGSGEPDAP